MFKKTARPLPALLLTTVAGIDATTQEDVENARFARRLATEGLVSFDQIFEVKNVLSNKMTDLFGNGGGYTEQVQQELAGAIAGVDNQIAMYEKRFEGAKTIQTDTDVGAGMDPMVADQAFDARRGNGHAKILG